MKVSPLVMVIIVVVLGAAYFLVFKPISPRNSSPATVPQTTTTPSNSTPSSKVTSSRYQDYSPESFAQATNVRRIYFFHANWCPTCKVANQEFTSQSELIPQDVIIFKTDYDSQVELKRKYAITYQHTFVQVDQQGNEVTKWNGGGISELVSRLK